MKHFIILLLILPLGLWSQNGSFKWAKSFGGIADGNTARCIKTDKAGNVYTVGDYTHTVDFNPGIGLFNLTANHVPNRPKKDVFIQKLDSNGNFLWAKSFGGPDHDNSSSLAIDTAGNIYITGNFKAIADFDPGAGTANFTSIDGTDLYILKLNSNGQYIWAKTVGARNNNVAGNAIDIDPNGNVLVTGRFNPFSNGGSVDFDPGPATNNIVNSKASDAFVLKLNANGQYVWAKSFGGDFSVIGFGIATDEFGNCYTTGTFSDRVDFDPGAGIFSRKSKGGDDFFVQKLDSNGNFEWTALMGGTSYEKSNDIAIDDSGNVLVTGYFQLTVDFDPSISTLNLTSNGLHDAFVQKISPTGSLLWAKSFGSTSYDGGTSITTDTTGNIYVAGDYWYSVDFDPNSGVYNLTSNGRSDVFVQKLSGGGNFIWAKSVGGKFDDGGGPSIANNGPSVHISGSFTDTADFNPETGIFNLIDSGRSDLFILKLGACIPVAYDDTIIACDSLTWINGITYKSDTTANDTNLTSGGCSSIVTLRLTVLNSNHFIDTVVACDSFTWINGITYTASNTIATDTFKNVVGCDSIVRLQLTIHGSSSAVDTVLACDSYTWIDGKTYTSNNNTAKDTLKNSLGCDSILTLNLVILQPSSSVDSVKACSSYTWINGTTYTTSNNTAQFTLKNTLGCDSVVSLRLTIVDVTFGIDSITACGFYNWNGVKFTASNFIATDTLTNSKGCDSIVTLNLTINSVDTSATVSNGSISSNATSSSYTWIDCSDGKIISNANSKSYTPEVDGSYAVIITTNGCVDTSKCFDISTLSSVVPHFFSKVLVYPNPSTGVVNVNLGDLTADIRIYNTLGAEVYSEKSNSGIVQIELPNAPGEYFIEVTSNSETASYKIIRQY